MRIQVHRVVTIIFILMVSGIFACHPASAIEDGLMGVRIGSSYRELTQRYGPPDGILFASGVFQTVATQPTEGLPDFGAQSQTEVPVWVLPVRVGAMEANRSQWLYDFRRDRGVSLGIVLSGEGADAVVTDVIVSGYPQYLRGKPSPVRTAKGVELQDTFEDVIRKYGYPPLIEIFTPSGTTAAPAQPAVGGAMGAAGRGGMQTGGMRAGMAGRGAAGGMAGGARGGAMGGARGGPMGGPGMRGGSGMRGGRGMSFIEPGIRTAQSVGSFELVLTGAPGGMRGGMGGPGMRGGPAGGMRGGMAGGMGMRGGMAGGAARAGTAAGLPPLGTQPPDTPGETYTTTATMDRQSIAFSRSCTLVYEGIAFTLHDMKVYRIHVSE